MLSVVAEVLGVVRRAKTTAKRRCGRRWPGSRWSTTRSGWPCMIEAEDDLRDAGGVVDLVTSVGPTEVSVVLGPEEPG